MKTILFALSLFLSFPALACPLAAGESELSFSRVMQNFGRLLIRPDSVARTALSNPASVTQIEIKEAIDAVNSAISCAQASLESKDFRLLPRAAQGLTGDAIKVYRTKFNHHMGEFKTLLESYREVFMKALKLEPAARDFSKAVILDREIRKKASDSHENL